MTPDPYQISNSGYRDEWGGFSQGGKSEVKRYGLSPASGSLTSS
jgi:hypothetical protein